ncbi:MAG: hypothetical protein KGZ39_06025 [Simkania sp.]|nr:hypothetical protein [Simkania sp.]
MDWNRKKMWPAVATSLVALTSLLNAAEETQMRNLENRVSALEQRKGSNGMINPPARPVVRDGVGLSLQGDVILWQASESGMTYAVQNFPDTQNPTAITFLNNGKAKNPHGEWDWGFKLAAGYDMPHDGWDLFLQWTRFYTDNNEHGTSAPTNGTIFPSFTNGSLLTTGGGPGAATTGFAAVSAHWRLHLNLLDLELGREFYVSKWLTLRPHAGLRNAWIDQHLNCTYTNGSLADGSSAVLTNQNIAVHMKNNYWGMGIRGGLDGNWGLGGGFSLFSDLAAALLLGHFDVSQTETSPTTTATNASGRLGYSNHFRATRVTLDMAMGVRYEHLFSDDRYGFMLQLGWEQHLFFSQNQLARFFGGGAANATVTGAAGANVVGQGDLSTQGVTLSAKFDF